MDTNIQREPIAFRLSRFRDPSTRPAYTATLSDGTTLTLYAPDPPGVLSCPQWWLFWATPEGEVIRDTVSPWCRTGDGRLSPRSAQDWARAQLAAWRTQ